MAYGRCRDCGKRRRQKRQRRLGIGCEQVETYEQRFPQPRLPPRGSGIRKGLCVRVGQLEIQQRPTRRNEQQNPAAEPPLLWTPLGRGSHQSRLHKLSWSVGALTLEEDPLKWQERHRWKELRWGTSLEVG